MSFERSFRIDNIWIRAVLRQSTIAQILCQINEGRYAALTSFSKSGWRSSTLSNLTNASGGLVLPFS